MGDTKQQVALTFLKEKLTTLFPIKQRYKKSLSDLLELLEKSLENKVDLYKTQLDFMEFLRTLQNNPQEIGDLNEKKQTLRNDLQKTNDELRKTNDLLDEQKNAFQALQDQSYLETEIAYSIAKLDPTNEGLKLLEHPFVEVRNGAILGIGHFANLNIFKDILNAFDKTSLNEPIKRFALYRAIDVSLMTLESDAKPEDVEPLTKIKENLPETTHQHQAIKQRLEWTLNEINYRLKNPKNEDEFEEISFESPKETED